MSIAARRLCRQYRRRERATRSSSRARGMRQLRSSAIASFRSTTESSRARPSRGAGESRVTAVAPVRAKVQGKEMLQAASLTFERIAAITGGTLSGPAGASPSGYSIDTRSIKPGDLFFAIVGPNQDGHRFAADAMAKGAAGVVVSDPAAIPELPCVIVVPDTLRALQDLAAFVRRAHPVKVVAITGSSGKTTTKEMTRQ